VGGRGAHALPDNLSNVLVGILQETQLVAKAAQQPEAICAGR
jgi:hypothetical protein